MWHSALAPSPRRRALAAVVAAGSILLAMPAAHAAELRVLVTSAMRGAYDALVPRFERSTGHRLVSEYDLPPALIRRVDAGEPFDVIILSYDVQDLIKQGKITPDSRTVLGRSGIGIAVRRGAPRPEFETVAAFTRALLAADAIATSGEGSSGRYVLTLLDRLGVADRVRPKIRSGGPGYHARALANGEVDFVISGLPPLLGTPSIEWLGYLPAELQSWVVFSGGLNPRAGQPEGGRALLRFLASPEAAEVFKANGIEPAS